MAQTTRPPPPKVLEFGTADDPIPTNKLLLRGFGAALAEIDVAAALAELAVKRIWTRPLVDASLSFRIEGGRHPVVETALRQAGELFVATDCGLRGDAG